MNDAELVIKRRLTREFIARDPLTVQFTRHDRVRNGRGGYTTEERSISPQTVRLVKSSLPRHKGAEAATTAGAQTLRFDRLVAMSETDMQAGDTFVNSEGRTMVLSMIKDQRHKREAVIEEQ